MSFATKHRKGGIDWGINADGFEFKTREELYKEDPEKIYTLRGLYINKKGRFGDHPVAITDEFFVDFPDYMCEEMEAVLKDSEDIEDIKSGIVLFKISTFEDKNFKKLCYGIEWIDKEV